MMLRNSLRVGGLAVLFFFLYPIPAAADWSDDLAAALLRRDYAGASRAIEAALERLSPRVDEALLRTWFVREDVIENCPLLPRWIGEIASRVAWDSYPVGAHARRETNYKTLEEALIDALASPRWWENPGRSRQAARLLRRLVGLNVASPHIMPRLNVVPWRDSLNTGAWIQLLLDQDDAWNDTGLRAIDLLRTRELPVSQTVPILYAIIAIYGEDILGRGDVDNPRTIRALAEMLIDLPERWVGYVEIEYIVDELIARGVREVDFLLREKMLVEGSPWVAKYRTAVWRRALASPISGRRAILKSDRTGLPRKRPLHRRLWSALQRWCPGHLLAR